MIETIESPLFLATFRKITNKYRVVCDYRVVDIGKSHAEAVQLESHCQLVRLEIIHAALPGARVPRSLTPGVYVLIGD